MEDNISSGRKIFRLFKFLEELNELNSVLHNKKFHFPLKVIKSVSHSLSFFYFVTDNMLWLMQIGYVNKKFLGIVQWKKLKDFFSLWKSFIEVITSVYVVHLANKRQKELVTKLGNIDLDPDDLIVEGSEQHDVFRKLILAKRKNSF